MTLERVLRDLRDELVALFGAGLATPGPGRAEALRSVAETMAAAGLGRAGAAVDEVANVLDEVVASPGDRERLRALHERIQWLLTWEAQFQRALALRASRRAIADGGTETVAAMARPPGIDGPVTPVGVAAIDDRIRFVLRIEGSGERLVLHDDWPASNHLVRNRFTVAQASRLFQEPVVPADLMRTSWRLSDHPAVRRRGGWVGGPSFFTRPELRGEAIVGDPMSDTLTVRWSSEGWTLWRDEAQVEVVRNAAIDFNLRKQQVVSDTIDVRLAPYADEHVIVAMRGANGEVRFPMVDPAAVRWSLDELAGRLAIHDHRGVQSLMDRLASGRAPEEPPTTIGEIVAGATGDGTGEARLAQAAAGIATNAVDDLVTLALPVRPSLTDVVRRALALPPTDAREFVEAHTTRLAREVRRGEVVPPGRDLWLISALWTQLFGEDSGTHALPGVAIDLDRLRNAAVNTLARTLGGDGVGGDEIEDALILIVACGDAEQFFEPGS